jgi:AraC-like DNA-binding protein
MLAKVGVDEYVQARPGAALRPYVAAYSGYRQRGVVPARHRGLPSPYLTLIFTIDEPLVVAAHPDPRQAPGEYDALLGGLHLTPATITHDGCQSGVQISVRPLACRALLGLPAAELASVDVDAAAVLGATVVDEIRDRLRTRADWPARFAAVEQVLIRRLRECTVAPEVAYAYRRLTEDTVAVAALADEVGWSARYLTDRFRAEVGLRPKQTARVARFDRVRRALRPDARLADIAADHGYADQSHLVREFQAFAGCPPSRWLADEFGFVQSLRELSPDDRRHD